MKLNMEKKTKKPEKEYTDKSKMKFTILAIVVIIILCIAITPVTLQNDTYYTVEIGKHIMEEGIDMSDPFSWHDLSYTYPHWLYDVVIYLIYNMFGWLGVYISTVILACTLGVLLHVTNKKLIKNPFTSFLLVVRSHVFNERVYCCKSTTPNLYIICTYHIFYRKVYRDEKDKICNRTHYHTNSYC